MVHEAKLTFRRGRRVYAMRSDTGVRAVLFDLDNTLVRFIDAQKAACRAVVELAGAGTADGLFACFLRPVHGFESPAHIGDYLASIGHAADLDEAADLYEAAKLAALEPTTERRPRSTVSATPGSRWGS